MILRQFLHTDPAGVSCLFGCGGKAAGAVVDPDATRCANKPTRATAGFTTRCWDPDVS
jgi:hypothetical protein